ncbi:hypothetical protein ACGFZP_36170 [Kitasatospora sp. NPDC048239]|uniref:hypothetical protein n=1 Tax=Kitasatospora sp. NPDC048239 TaxID=3364046 RepID=UPI0037239FEF
MARRWGNHIGNREWYRDGAAVRISEDQRQLSYAEATPVQAEHRVALLAGGLNHHVRMHGANSWQAKDVRRKLTDARNRVNTLTWETANLRRELDGLRRCLL